MPVTALPADALYHRCSTDGFDFATTEDLPPLHGLLGQDRALQAIRFGTRINHGGYNMFVLGPPQSGFETTVTDLLKQLAQEEPVPSDWVYVNNFSNQNTPKALQLRTGDGRRLRDRVAGVIEDLRNTLPAIFQSDEYLRRRKAIDEALERRHTEALGVLQKKAEGQGIALVSTQNGVGVAPLRDNGEVMPSEEFVQLPEAERKRIEGLIGQIQEAVEEIFRAIPRWESERVDRLRTLNRDFANFAVTHSINDMRSEFSGDASVLDWLDELAVDIVDQIALFAPEAAEKPETAERARAPGTPGNGGPNWQDPFQRYQINLFVDNARTRGAPVIELDHPSLTNLVGKIEHRAQMGALVTDPTLIRSGAIHRANGGYLLVDAIRLFKEPFAWEALARGLTRLEAVIESASDYYPMTATMGLQPEPIPLDVKVVLFGTPALYYLLARREHDFARLFKVQVDFSDRIERTEENQMLYARLVGTQARDHGLKPLSPAGVARLIEHGSRLADDGERLSILMDPITDVLREADYCARETGADQVDAEHIDQALSAQAYRADRLRERIQDSLVSDMLLVDTQGERVGQINSLFVRSLPNFRFGSPSRVTARVRAGGQGVMNIERSVGFGRSIYNKGVEILSAWFLSRFAKERGPHCTVSIVHEQNYGSIDGDSASSTELYVLMSALSGVPIRQDLAVTGSVNQFGEVQVIGGVNEKIEGFFDLCAERGLTGTQGVMIPAANARNLMLRGDIVEAAEAGRFHIYPIETVEQGIELLMGVEAGEPGEDGAYPEDSIYGQVARRLKELSPATRNASNSASQNANGTETNGQKEQVKAPKKSPWWWPF
ncbi:MAG: Lon protease family protein [Alphaproteobacteria bacterium]